MESDQPSVGYDLDGLSAANKKLSEREIEILCLVATGASNKEIAQQLFISPNTVKVHLRNTFSKIGVASRTEAALFAIRQGLVEGASSNSAIPSQDRADSGEKAWHSNWPRLLRSWPLAGALLILALGGLTWTILRDRGTPVSASPSPPSTTSIDRWKTRAALPTARAGLAVASNEGYIYAIGGETSQEVTGAFERYDPATDTWMALPAKPVAVSDVRAAVIGSDIFVPGGRLATGEVTSLMEAYDLREGRWTSRAPIPVALSAYGLAAHEGRLYLFGGWDGETYTSSVYEYDPVQDQWYPRAPMSTARGYAGAAASAGGIYVVGGYDGEKALSVNELYIPSQDYEGGTPWLLRAPMPNARYGMGMVSVADILHVIGGQGADNATSLVEYFPQRDEWQDVYSPVAEPWSDLGLAVLETKLYVLGGRQGGVTSDRVLSYKAIYTVLIPILPAGE